MRLKKKCATIPELCSLEGAVVKASFYWKGMTIFYKTHKEGETEPVYIQLPDGLYKADFQAA